jgi:hypothetical protein
VRAACAVALGTVGGVDSLDALQVAVLDNDANVANAAAQGLAGLGVAGEERLETLTQSSMAHVARRAHEWQVRGRIDGDIRRRRDVIESISSVDVGVGTTRDVR